MRRIMLKSKIHRATVTAADPDYEGSLTVDPQLLALADILPFEQVHVLDVDTGARVVTYAIEGEPGSGTIQANGAAARLIRAGDTVIVASYVEVDDAEAQNLEPRVVLVDERNRPAKPVAV